MDVNTLLGVYRAMRLARQVDMLEREMVRRGEAFFHVPGMGHESTAFLAPLLIADDWLLPHYRDKALLIARGMSPARFLDGALCNVRSTSQGRQMSAHICDRALHVVSMGGPVGNAALHAVGIAAVVKPQPTRPLVVCCLGDGTTQEGEFYEAVAEAARSHLPVLFLIQDNGWAISTRTTGRTLYRHQNGLATSFHGVPIRFVDGKQPQCVWPALCDVVEALRTNRQPQIVVLDVERLSDHTNADDQRVYRPAEEIQLSQQIGDPLTRCRQWLAQLGVAECVIQSVDDETDQLLRQYEQEALAAEEPSVARDAKIPIHIELTHPSQERSPGIVPGGLPMRDALREVLRWHLRQNPRVWLWGQDIEDPKGDVFGVTRGLSTEFPGRVCNAPLAEATIVGAAIGRALAGQHPVAFIQFADFLPLAWNQIVNELATFYWRSVGSYSVPLIVMAPCGAYRPGLGPFHSQTAESWLAHVPGLDVLVPSTASDAAGLLNAAFASRRPTLFLYPKSLLNDAATGTTANVSEHFVPLGVAKKLRAGRDLTMVAWGNTVRICSQVCELLEEAGVEVELFDLRSIAPWDDRSILASAEHTSRLLVVHEDNQTCGFGAEILATVAERARMPVAMRRVTRPDVFTPCHFPSQLALLPSMETVLAAAADLLHMDLRWQERPLIEDEQRLDVPAIGSGPADETVTVVEWLVQPGQHVQRSKPLVCLEATKSVFELTAPCDGLVETLHAQAGEAVPVGQPLVTLRVSATSNRRRRKPTRTAVPILERRPHPFTIHLPRRDEPRRSYDVGISHVTTATGSRIVTNADLVGKHARLSPDDVFRRTGIQQRFWVAPGETAVSLAARACRELLDREKMVLQDLDLVVCATTSPTAITPSMACQVLSALSGSSAGTCVQAYDINAACSGYLYALQAGYDFLQSRPEGRVLILTTEVLSPMLDPNDLDTTILFGDATSATLLFGEAELERAVARIHRPELSAKAENGQSLSVPLPHEGFIQMKGRKVFTEAVKAMVSSLNRACTRLGISLSDLTWVIPHQANQRILDAIASRIPAPVFSNIRYYGNTSSTSIPLCLAELMPKAIPGSRLGLCAFGGGFTFGAGILERAA